MAGYFDTLKKPYFIAEIGVNHNGDVALARQMIDEAKACGADAVKFQSFSADTEACRSTLSAPHVDEALGFEGTFYELLEKLSISHEEQRQLKAYCDQIGIPFLSSPFSFPDIDFLVGLDVPFLKIGSTDTHHLAFLDHAARTGKPILLSTGMATMAEVQDAVNTITTVTPHLALMHCVSLYPPEASELNLQAITALRQQFPGIPTGWSDHSIGSWASVAAIALGATIIEKHFTLDKTMPGPDQAVSADPAEMRRIVEEGTLAYQALGTVGKQPTERERAMVAPFRRSVCTRQAVRKGELIRLENLDFKRPGIGVPPNEVKRVAGAIATQDIPEDSPIQEGMFAPAGSPVAQDVAG
ncbi:MAG: N-acetylneuraminate synthase family protein [Candidatus Melainabacteria bacterium]